MCFFYLIVIYIFACNIKTNTMKKVRSLNLDDEIVAKLKRIGKAEFNSPNMSAAVSFLVNNYKEDKK